MSREHDGPYLTPEEVKALVYGDTWKPKRVARHWVVKETLDTSVALLIYDPIDDQPIEWHSVTTESAAQRVLSRWRTVRSDDRSILIPVPLEIELPNLSTLLDYRRLAGRAVVEIEQSTFSLVGGET